MLDGGGSGSLTITGRAKELIKRGGEQVSPYEVEAAVRGHESVVFAVAFAVPSAVWGEEVGVAIVLEDDTGPAATKELTLSNRTLLREMRDACRACGLAAHKIEHSDRRRSVEAAEDANGQGDPKRVGGAPRRDNGGPEVARAGPPRISPALAGVRFVLAAQVVFNHVGISEGASGGMWGAVGAARFFCVHVPTFYALAAFSLSSTMGAAALLESRLRRGAAGALVPDVPPFLLLLLVTLLIQCNPANFDDEFHWEAQPTDTLRGDFCEPAAGLSTWGGSFVSTIAIYGLGLQSWPLYHYAWPLSYYTWFSRVLRAAVHAAVLVLAPRRIAGREGRAPGAPAPPRRPQLLRRRRLLRRLRPPPRRRRAPRRAVGQLVHVGVLPLPAVLVAHLAMGATAAFLFDAHRPYFRTARDLWGCCAM